MRILNIILKVVFCLIMAMPVLGVTGLLGEPSPELYNTPEAFNFILTLMDAGYIPYINALVFALGIVLVVTKRTLLASLLVLPITVNVVAFHFFLDGGIFTSGAIAGDILFLLNLYFIWVNRAQLAQLLEKSRV